MAFEQVGVQAVIKGLGPYLAGVDKMNSKTGGFAKNLAKFAKVGAIAATAAIAGLGAASIKMAIDFESAFAEVKTLLPQLSEEAFGQLQDDLLAFSKEMGIATDQAVPALYQAISAGVPPKNVMTFMQVAAKAAIGGVTDLETAVDGITSVINAYGTEVISAQEAADIMFTGVKLGKTTFDELSSSLFNVIPIAAASRISFAEVTAELAVLTATGVPTATATTGLRQAFIEAAKGGTKLDLAIKELTDKSFQALIDEGTTGAEVFELLRSSMPDQEFKDLFSSVEAMNVALAITGPNASKVQAAMDEMATSAGAVDEAFETISETTKFKLNKAINSLKIQLLEIGLDILPVVTDALEILTVWLDENVPKGIEAMKAAFASAKPTILSFGENFAAGLQSIKEFFNFIINNKVLLIASITAIGVAIFLALGPVSQAALAITAFIALLGVLRRNQEEIAEFFRKNWQEIASIVSIAMLGPFGIVTVIATNAFGIRDAMIGIVKAIVPPWDAGWRLMGQVVTTILRGVVTVVETSINAVLFLVRQLFIGIKAAADAFPGPNPLGNAMQAAIDGMKEVTLSGAVDLAQDMFQMGSDAVTGFLSGLGSGGGGGGPGGLSAASTGLVKEVLDPWGNVIHVFEETGAESGDSFMEGLQEAFGFAGGGGAGDGGGAVAEIADAVVGAFGDSVAKRLAELNFAEAAGSVATNLIMALTAAIIEQTPQTIAALDQAAADMLFALQEGLDPVFAEQVGEDLMAALVAALESGNDEAVQAILLGIAEMKKAFEDGTDEIVSLLDAFQNEMAEIMEAEAAQERFGRAGANLMEALEDALGEGGASAAAEAARIAKQIMDSLDENLTEAGATSLGNALMSALQTALQTSGEGAIEALAGVLAGIERLIEKAKEQAEELAGVGDKAAADGVGDEDLSDKEAGEKRRRERFFGPDDPLAALRDLFGTRRMITHMRYWLGGQITEGYIGRSQPRAIDPVYDIKGNVLLGQLSDADKWTELGLIQLHRGMFDVPFTGLMARLQQGEMVLPRSVADIVRREMMPQLAPTATGGGGGETSVTITQEFFGPADPEAVGEATRDVLFDQLRARGTVVRR